MLRRRSTLLDLARSASIALSTLSLFGTACATPSSSEAAAPTSAALGAPTAPAQGQGAASPDAPSPDAPPPDVGAAPADAERSPSGLAWKRLVVGTGTISPGRFDRARVSFTAWTPDGQVFDDSKKRPEPPVIILATAIPGLSEALQGMVRGEKRRLWIPEALAYQGRADGPKGPVVFDLEVLDVFKIPRPINIPEDLAAPPPTARAVDGIHLRTLVAGKGKVKPGPKDIVVAHFTGWSPTGRLLDSTLQRGEPIELAMGSGLRGWSIALQEMVVGEKVRTWLPEALAYAGEPGRQRGPVVFDIELLEIKKPPKPIPPPKHVKAPPKNAEKTASGLAFVVLKKGTGTERPTIHNRVRVHYTGWTTDGKTFDSSVARGRPALVELHKVIAGWREALQLMVAGEKRLLWIPEELAYGGQPGTPQGMLVFEVEVLEVLEEDEH